jgi:hypothetical protein
MNVYGEAPERRVKRIKTNTVAEITADNGVQLWETGRCKDAALLCDTISTLGGASYVDMNSAHVYSATDVRYKQLQITSSLSAAPAPAADTAVIWQDDGTTHMDGDLMVTVNNGSSTVTGTLMPFTPIRQGVYENAVTDINFNGTTNVLVTDAILTLEPGTYWVAFAISLNFSVADEAIVLLVEDPTGVPADVTNSMVACGGFAGRRHTAAGGLVMVVAATTTYQLAFRWATSADTAGGIDVVIGTGATDPDSTANLVARKIA